MKRYYNLREWLKSQAVWGPRVPWLRREMHQASSGKNQPEGSDILLRLQNILSQAQAQGTHAQLISWPHLFLQKLDWPVSGFGMQRCCLYYTFLLQSGTSFWDLFFLAVLGIKTQGAHARQPHSQPSSPVLKTGNTQKMSQGRGALL